MAKRALFRPVFLPTSEIEALPIVNGQFIINSETFDYYIDEGGVRHGKGRLIEVTKSQLLDLVKSNSLLKGCRYLVTDYKYKNAYDFEASNKYLYLSELVDLIEIINYYTKELDNATNPHDIENYKRVINEYKRNLKIKFDNLYNFDKIINGEILLNKSNLEELLSDRLIVTASSSNSIEKVGFSVNYPEDYIEVGLLKTEYEKDENIYIFEGLDLFNGIGKSISKFLKDLGDKPDLVITKREDVSKNIRCTFDFRGHYNFMWDTNRVIPIDIVSHPVLSAFSTFNIDNPSSGTVDFSHVTGYFQNSTLYFSVINGRAINSKLSYSICKDVTNSIIKSSKLDTSNNSVIEDSIIYDIIQINNSKILRSKIYSKYDLNINSSYITGCNIAGSFNKIYLTNIKDISIYSDATITSLVNVVFEKELEYYLEECDLISNSTIDVSNTTYKVVPNLSTLGFKSNQYPNETTEKSVVVISGNIINRHVRSNVLYSVNKRVTLNPLSSDKESLPYFNNNEACLVYEDDLIKIN